MKLHIGAGGDIRKGFLNMDKEVDGWEFEEPLPFKDCSIEAITISHALSAVPEFVWEVACSEFWRVLKFGGVLRITDDDTENPASPRYIKPYPGVRSFTGPQMAKAIMLRSGFRLAANMKEDETWHTDKSLLIAHRAGRDYVFYVEALK